MMKPSAQSGTQGDRGLSEAIDRLWVRFVPEIKERIAELHAAAEALTAGTLTASHRETAHAAAHKLAGVLGSFGLTRGTVLARELEINFSREDGPDRAKGKKLAAIAAELRKMVESRRSAG